MTTPQPAAPISPAAQAMLDSLRSAVRKELERKRRLGHYAVLWQDNGPVLVGEDAPDNAATTTTITKP